MDITTQISELKKKLFKVSELSSADINGYLYGVLKFTQHNKSGSNIKYAASGFFIKKYHTQLKAVKVRINQVGKIERYK